MLPFATRIVNFYINNTFICASFIANFVIIAMFYIVLPVLLFVFFMSIIYINV